MAEIWKERIALLYTEQIYLAEKMNPWRNILNDALRVRKQDNPKGASAPFVFYVIYLPNNLIP